MKILNILMFLMLLSLTISKTSIAGTEKMIQLHDGSLLKGTVVELSNGMYTIQTQNLGKIKIDASKISSISDHVKTSQKNDSKSSIMALQSQFMADPNFINQVMEMSKNPEIMKVLSDPKFTEDVQNFDLEAVQNNPQTQKLLANPEIKALMEQMQKSLK